MAKPRTWEIPPDIASGYARYMRHRHTGRVDARDRAACAAYMKAYRAARRRAITSEQGKGLGPPDHTFTRSEILAARLGG